MLYRPARAYDWAWDMFTADERAKIQAAFRERVIDAWNSGEVQRGVGHLQKPYGSHANRTWHKIAEAGIAFLDEIPEAPQWLDYAVNKFFACYPVWSDDDGGWHEGVSYWSGYQSRAVWWLQVAKSALDLDGLKKPFFAQVGDYPEIRAEAERIAAALRPVASCNVQLRVHQGKPVTFEINVRFSGTTPMRARMGFNEVEAALRHYVLGEDIPDLPRITEGIAVRYWNELYIAPEAYAALARDGKLDDPHGYRTTLEDYGSGKK